MAASVICYHQTIDFPFHFDGQQHIVENPNIGELSWNNFPSRSRSLVSTSWRLNYRVSGKNPFGYHLVNIAIHTASGLLLFGLVYRTLRFDSLPNRYRDQAGILSGIIALVWTVHPLQTQAVTYIIQRYESLMGMLLFLAVFCLACSANSSRKWLWFGGCVLACYLAMVSKEVAVVLPLLLLWYDRAFISPSWKSLARNHFPLHIAAFCTWLVLLPIAGQSEQTLQHHNVAYVVETSLVDGQVVEQSVGSWDYLLSQPQAILLYLRLVLVPYGQSLDHGWRATTTLTQAALPGMIILVLLGCTFWSMFKYPRWSFLGGWFFLVLAPTSSILPIKDVAVEHRMYVPSAAVLALVVLLVFEGLCRQYGSRKQAVGQIRRSMLVAGVATTLLLAGVTLARNEVYRTRLGIWQDVVAKAPDFARGHYGIARTFVDAGQLELAVPPLQRALELDPAYAEAYVTLGRIVRSNQPDYATQLFAAAVKIAPNYSEAHNNLGAMLSKKSPEIALSHYRQAIELNQRNADAHNNLANLLARGGELAEAIQHYEVAILIRPNFELAVKNLETVRQMAAAQNREHEPSDSLED
ncbi:tetratricopeptide repeat protein [Bremerella sp. JC770]|uniref:tetratricopeptide repeat protein n=1 Tax=Bremerella sp. JC770 TaxID=3232137 RepID=UPI00345A968F